MSNNNTLQLLFNYNQSNNSPEEKIYNKLKKYYNNELELVNKNKQENTINKNNEKLKNRIIELYNSDIQVYSSLLYYAIKQKNYNICKLLISNCEDIKKIDLKVNYLSETLYIYSITINSNKLKNKIDVSLNICELLLKKDIDKTKITDALTNNITNICNLIKLNYNALSFYEQITIANLKDEIEEINNKTNILKKYLIDITNLLVSYGAELKISKSILKNNNNNCDIIGLYIINIINILKTHKSNQLIINNNYILYLNSIINKIIKNIISNSLKINILIDFLYIIKKYIISNFDNIDYYNEKLKFEIYNAKYNKELLELIKELNSNNSLLDTNYNLKIEYEDQEGINYGGLLRDFFDNIEKQLNMNNSNINKEIKEINNKLSNIPVPRKSILSRLFRKKPQLNIKKLVKEKNELIKLKDEKCILENILKILAFSKKNNNPIFCNNKKLKDIILNEIIKLYTEKSEKELIYNILNSLNTGEEIKILNKENNLTENNVIKIKEIFLDKIENKIEKGELNTSIYNNYEKSPIYIETKKEYLESKKNKKNDNKNVQNLIDVIINKYKIYNNIYELYLLHFIQDKITNDLFINKLKFKFINENNQNLETIKEEFINKTKQNLETIKEEFINFFKSFTDEQLYIFNKLISGKTYTPAKEYLIRIHFNNMDKLPEFHTCFFTVDIYYNYFVNKQKYINNKNKYFNTMRNFGLGFGLL